MITIYDVAKRCNVSPSTVSKVINNYSNIPESTKEKVRQVMKEMDYIPNSSAKFLSKGSLNNVGVLAYFGTHISPFKHMLFTDILDSFQQTMNSKGYDLLFIGRTVNGIEESFYKNCVSRNVDGVLLFGDMEFGEMKEVVESNIPRIGFDYLGRVMSGVTSDNEQKMFELTEHIIYFGHKNIVYITGEDSPLTQRRITGFKDALAKHNIDYQPSMIVASRYVDFDSISRALDSVLSRAKEPTAIMFPDDYSAIEGMRLLREKGYRVPEDISVTGFDGINVGQMIVPRLTTVKQDTVKIGEVLAIRLISYMQKKKMTFELVEIKGQLILGETTGPVKI
ncbi:LacI family DNA-binding transcriptional regulator [Trichlorobacter sp.]|jgi:LacI family transcriptional regulator|uniref:LacI family DNA-binding transcriptional regulator n=1 Tax=Trichlorobacter sp. TaxID=2911007 RepID=UPI002A35925D|nr:LacI family DNA-binding transcriptional regulator [Trichlorobacter sp.]MDY0385458.1 LacI family DNA-binding transcriptional regulator [Trichlorobacter sp.]